MANHSREPSPRFSGHRRASWTIDDIDELTELRARQRTFDGAYIRTALGNLTFALVILKLFDRNFAKIGLLYVILSLVFLAISIARRARDAADFSDSNVVETSRNLLERAAKKLSNDPESTAADTNPPLSIAEAENEGVSRAQVENSSAVELLVPTEEEIDTLLQNNRNSKGKLRQASLVVLPPTKLPPASKRVWGKRPFRTSGDTIVALTVLVLAVEVALLVLLLRLPAV